MFEPQTESVITVLGCMMSRPSGKHAYARVVDEGTGRTADVTLDPHGQAVGVGSKLRVRWLKETPGRIHGEVL